MIRENVLVVGKSGCSRPPKERVLTVVNSIPDLLTESRRETFVYRAKVISR